MLFNSLHFLIFFPIVITLYFSIPHKHRWFLLLVSSYYFYMSWKAEYIILIIISTLVDYFAGISIYNSKKKIKRKIFLTLSLCVNLGLLFAFKYFNFFSDSFRELLQSFSIPLNPITLKVLLPVGISFYTFQTMSYTIDIYRKKIKPEKHFGIFAVYVSFFPQLVAGPIERAKNLLPQFYEKHRFNYKRVTDGLKLMLWGFFKKMVIADNLALIVNTVYSNVEIYSGTSLIIATVFFAFQIYCDFSGYSDIAIGASQIMGFRLMDNFKRPYFARTLTEFWKRWHISLSTWFRDYLYIPLGGNRVSVPRWCVNIFIVFVVSGLWHGANWTFVIWGAIHGAMLIFERLTWNFWTKLSDFTGLSSINIIRKGIQIIITFIIVDIGWIFFRADSLSDAIYVLTHLFTNISFDIASLKIGVGLPSLLLFIGFIGFMEFVHIIQEHTGVRQFLSDKPMLLRWSIYISIMVMISLFGVFQRTEFIYFQF